MLTMEMLKDVLTDDEINICRKLHRPHLIHTEFVQKNFMRLGTFGEDPRTLSFAIANLLDLDEAKQQPSKEAIEAIL